jgi:uncharacterized membrane protein YuzA (DUF378 family)
MTAKASSNLVSTILISLASIGAINWGLIGAADFNLVTYLLGAYTTLTRAVYISVGLGGLYSLFITIKSLITPTVIHTK